MQKFPTYLKERKVLESTVSWLLSELNKHQLEYYLLTNEEPNFK